MLKIGMIGAGTVASNHMYAIKEVSDVKLTCIADIDSRKREEYVRKYCASTYKDYLKMIDEEKINLVIINLPHYLHMDATIAAAKRGINILIEKPMALNEIQCHEMINVAKENKVKLFVGHTSRYSDCFIKLNKIVKSMEIGRLLMIHEKRYTDYFNDQRPEWFLKKKMAGGGITFNLGAHFFDHIHWASGGIILEVKGCIDNSKTSYDIEGSSHIFCQLDNGVSASCVLSGYSVQEEYYIEYIFTHGIVKVYPHNKLTIF